MVTITGLRHLIEPVPLVFVSAPSILINAQDPLFIDLFGQAGAGLKFKTTLGYLNLEVRSNFGLLNQTVRGGASAEALRWEYKYVDDDFNLNNLNLTLGYTQIFYKPSKRK